MKIIVSLAQIDIAFADPSENLRRGERRIIEAVRRKSSLICFPEMWTTAFDLEGDVAAKARAHEAVVARIAALAEKYSLWIGGSVLALSESGKACNAYLLFSPSGEKRGVYPKAHLFPPIREDEHFSPGDRLAVVDAPWGKTGLAICYDLRFPELFRSYALKGVKVQLLSAAFPRPREDHWGVLVRARAIEDQMFMLAVNRVGAQEFPRTGRVEYFGRSLIVDPGGKVLAEGSDGKEELLTAEIDLSLVERLRRKLPVLQDRRPEVYGLG
jgi:predicted amidohydrolase